MIGAVAFWRTVGDVAWRDEVSERVPGRVVGNRGDTGDHLLGTEQIHHASGYSFVFG